MSYQPINRSSDLKRLRDEGYDIEIRSNHLVVKNVPYLTSEKEVKRGTLVSTLSLAGDVTMPPDDHQAHFEGDTPCNADGSPLSKVINQSGRRSLAFDVEIDHSFSAKPAVSGRYTDYYEKVSTYVAILTGPAQTVDPLVTAMTYAPVSDTDPSTPFKYVDTASSRAGIGDVTARLEGGRIGIVGLGGTGSYILDLVAKTPCGEIHLFDGDLFLQHNAFRSPGAASIEALERKPNKAQYFADLYSNIRHLIFAHPESLNENNLSLLDRMTFVFICIDVGPDKLRIVQRLEATQVPFVDVGMGVYQVGNSLGGALRVTTSTPQLSQPIKERKRISFGDGDGNDAYSRNIQIADLNALNAALAVIKWKKLMGFYTDLEREHSTVYTIDGNALDNGDFNEM